MQILLANPRGFCAGVDRAISIVENTLKLEEAFHVFIPLRTEKS